MVGPVVIICTLAGLFPMWVWLAGKEPTTRHVLLHGWMPVIIAMLISSCSGVILERVVNTGYDYFKDLPVFQPLINGRSASVVTKILKFGIWNLIYIENLKVFSVSELVSF